MRATQFLFSGVAAGALVVVALGSTVAQAAAGQQSVVPAAASQAAPAPAPGERRICKRSAPSGSLIETRRECHTRAEWDRIAQAARTEGQDMVERSARSGQQ